jgi:hypothetical protein
MMSGAGGKSTQGGIMKFGFHGSWGMLTLFVLISYLVAPSSTNFYLLIVVSEIMAFSAVPLIKQAPLVTHIFSKKNWNIHAPHRDAFQRTITMLHYCCARLVMIENASAIDSYKNYIRVALFAFIYLYLVPNEKFDNWNTWFFGIPMFVGTVLDTIFLDLEEKVITQIFLVRLLLFANLISFAFTLAFRKTLDINKVYVVSVVGVVGIFLTIVPSIVKEAF